MSSEVDTTPPPVLRQARPLGVGHGARLRDTWLIGRSELVELVVAYVAIAIVGVAFGEFVVRHDEVNAITRLDDRVEQWFVDRRTPTWNSWSWLGSMLADTAVKVAVTAVVVLAMLWVWRRWLEATMVGVALILEATAFITITEIVRRPRPDVPKLEGSPVDSSFPSGHTAAAAAYAAVAVVFLWRHRRSIAALLFGLVGAVVVAVAVARMYRGMHHLSDVVSGAVLGAVSVAVVGAVVRRAAARRRIALDPAVADRAVTT
jgi:undecaprenyl-diphosphatase